jgi:hypothetical protein
MAAMRSVALLWSALLACAALPGWAQEEPPPGEPDTPAAPAKRADEVRGDAVGPLKVPDAHPRILVTAEELPAVRERIVNSGRPWQMLQAAGQRVLSGDPTEPMARMRSLQSRSHAISQGVATLAFWGLMSEDAAVRDRICKWFVAMDVSQTAGQLPADDYMPRGEFMLGFPLAYDWAKPWATETALSKLRELTITHATICHDGIAQKKNWEGRTEANNHSMAAMGGVGVAGLALWGEYPAARAWVKLTAQKVQSYLELSFDPDGACYEGNLYGPFGMGQALHFSAALKHLGGNDLYGEGRLVRMLHWCVSDAIPGDDASGQRFHANLTLYAAKHYGDGIAAWAYTKSSGRSWAPYVALWEHELPEARAPGPEFNLRWHSVRGLLNVRTGFGDDDVFASFEAGERRNGCHGQSDQGQFTLYGAGGWYAVDPGYSNKKDPDSGHQTLAHNLVLIDGAGQAITGGGWVVEAKMLRHDADAVATVAVADLKPAHDHKDHNPVMKALRTFAFIRTPGRPYVVVIDEIVKDTKAHDFDSILHTGKGNQVQWNGHVATITPGTGPTLRVHWLGPKITGTTATEDYGSYLNEHPVLHARAKAVAWFSTQLFEFEEEGVVFTTKKKSNKLVITVTRGSGDAALTDTLAITPGKGTRPARLELIRKRGKKREYKKRF